MANNAEMILLHTCVAAKPPPLGLNLTFFGTDNLLRKTYNVKNYEIYFKQLVQSVLDAG